MTLPASGAISLFDVNDELGLTRTAAIGLLCTNVRTLFNVASGAVGLQTGYGKANCAAPGSVTYSTPGTYTWTAPTGVRHVSIVAIGGGGGGDSFNGAGGGGLGWSNNLTTTPGTDYTVYVGDSGTRHSAQVPTPGSNPSYYCCTSNGGTGGTSYTTIPGSPVGYGGAGGRYTGTGNGNYINNTCACGGGYSGQGGGNGGNSQSANSKTSYLKWIGGGGGGGYSGNGGTATGGSLYYYSAPYTPVGSGGGAAGQTSSGYQSPGQGAYGQGGGGTGVASGKTLPACAYTHNAGQGGSGGTRGSYVGYGSTCPTQNPNSTNAGNIYIHYGYSLFYQFWCAAGGSYGGGGGAGPQSNFVVWSYGPTFYCGYNNQSSSTRSDVYGAPGGKGGTGVVRILWNGNVRSYPCTSTGSP